MVAQLTELHHYYHEKHPAAQPHIFGYNSHAKQVIKIKKLTASKSDNLGLISS
ncbi:hypothetical protein GMES_3936 [Paraglaciecola mesophila KMM 241]|uniref:Uncharacterized protein n=1 Tax=Paraglaciecola mesophila KMM 241 TaxID=1128912 RepID=K6Y046_9ALTE|nr:hypothetical protein GMES_3936 [Paraglaciecola mesophila KMM 241]